MSPEGEDCVGEWLMVLALRRNAGGCVSCRGEQASSFRSPVELWERSGLDSGRGEHNGSSSDGS